MKFARREVKLARMLQVTCKLGVHLLRELFYILFQRILLFDELGDLLVQSLLLLLVSIRLSLELAVPLGLLLLELGHFLLRIFNGNL
jgi:hypothetical protein